MTRPLSSPMSRSGLTLLETMVVIGVMMAVLSMMTQMLLLNYSLFDRLSGQSENETGAVMAAKIISQSVRGASSVEAFHDFDGNTVVSSENALVVRLPAIDGADGIIPNGYDYIGFYRDGTDDGKIMAVTDPDAQSVRQAGIRTVTDDNLRLAFRYDRPNPSQASRVSVMVVNRQVRRGQAVQSRGWVSIFLRNL
ncbi:hypothetical protein JW899_01815 [Candidatus Uhrbacteria bacterium]|nr:hypothetical protein [Candidatus Uhrbacteria bacterium]